MKKFLMLAAASLAAGSLAFVVNSPASAGPYSGTINTTTNIGVTVGQVNANNKAPVTVTVNITAPGNVDPTGGQFDLKLFDDSTTPATQIDHRNNVPYSGGPQDVSLGKLPLGSYTVTVNYQTPDPASPYKNSNSSQDFSVPMPPAPFAGFMLSASRLF